MHSKLDNPKELYKPDSTQPPSHQKMASKSKQHLAERMRDKSTRMENTEPGELPIYKLPLRCHKKSGSTQPHSHQMMASKPKQHLPAMGDSMIVRYFVGEESHGCIHPEKVLMLFGATGSGKTTLINGMVNYLLGVCWDDNFRFKLITEESKSQSVSHCRLFTAYTLFHQDGFPVPYTLTIIDTPGFGDTIGFVRGREIIKEFFSLPPSQGGIDKLDGIGFVTQAALARLTPIQHCIFDSILPTLGKNIKNNIFMMITFADRKKPPVVEAIEARGIPYHNYFKFNNSAMYSKTDNDDAEWEFDQMFWRIGMKSFQNFFTTFEHVEDVSLQQTKEVLHMPHQIEATIQDLQHQITEGLPKIDELKRENLYLQQHEADILISKEFTYTVTVTKQRKVDHPIGHYTMKCLLCNCTCHFHCDIGDDIERYKCVAMDRSAKCTICPGKCSWKKHARRPHYFELYEDTEERTFDELKKKYRHAVQGKTKAERKISAIQSHLSTVDGMIREVKDSLQRLDEIALKPNPLSDVEYIDCLIQSEQQEHKDGWNQRVQYLQGAKKQAQIQAQMKGLELNPEQREAERKALWGCIIGWWNS